MSFYEKALLLAKEENRIIDKEIFNEKISLSLVEVLEKEIVKMDGVKKFSTVTKYGILKDQVKSFKDIPVDNINKAWMENFALHLEVHFVQRRLSKVTHNEQGFAMVGQSKHKSSI